MFARADVTGRLVQQRGFLAANLVPDIERAARRSRELDPNFRDGAATRLLGTLYVIAPAAVLEHGDSEQGLELLEGLVRGAGRTCSRITCGWPRPTSRSAMPRPRARTSAAAWQTRKSCGLTNSIC